MTPRSQSPTDYSAIARRLRLTRMAAGYDDYGGQARFARRLNLGTGRWNNYETGGDKPIPFKVALLVVQVTGATLDWIYLGDRSGLPQRLVTAIEKLERSE